MWFDIVWEIRLIGLTDMGTYHIFYKSTDRIVTVGNYSITMRNICCIIWYMYIKERERERERELNSIWYIREVYR